MIFNVFLKARNMEVFFIIVPATYLLYGYLTFFSRFSLAFSFTFSYSNGNFREIRILRLYSNARFFYSRFASEGIGIYARKTFLGLAI